MKMPNPEDFTKVSEPKHYSVADHAIACDTAAKSGIIDAILKSKDVVPPYTGFGMDFGVKDVTAISLVKDGSVIDFKTPFAPTEIINTYVSHKSKGLSWKELYEGDWSAVSATAQEELLAHKESQIKHLLYGEFQAKPFTGFKPALSTPHKRTDINIMPFTDDELANIRAFKQAVFDRVVYGLTEQGAPGYDPGGGIKYHAYNGSRCALGFFIDKRDYRHEMEGLQGSDHILLKAMRVPEWLHHIVDDYMGEVRHALHDGLAERFNFERDFDNAAETFRKRHRLAPANTAPLREYDEAHREVKRSRPSPALYRRSYLTDLLDA